MNKARRHFFLPNDETVSLFWGDVFSHDDHDHENLQRARRDSDIQINPTTDNPYYCDEPPQLINPSPESGSELEVSGDVTIHLGAMYYEDLKVKYDLNRFQYNSPQGMTCSKINKETGQARLTIYIHYCYHRFHFSSLSFGNLCRREIFLINYINV